MHYELLYIVPIKFTEEELKNVTGNVSGLIEKAGGKITKDENLGKKKLAYPIKGCRHGYYILSEMDMETSGLKQLNRDLGLAQEIIRYQIVKKSENVKPPRKPREIPEERVGKQETPFEKDAVGKEDIPEAKKGDTIMENAGRAEIEKEKEESKGKEKLSMEELDKKLDEILEIDEA